MKNAIIECTMINPNGEREVLTFHSDSNLKEFLIYNTAYKFIEARKIVLLQTYNVLTEEFEWV